MKPRGATTFFGARRAVPVLVLEPETISEALRRRPRAVEFRADLFRKGRITRARELMCALNKTAGCSVLLTARRTRDGGSWPGSKERERRLLLSRLIPYADVVDLELDLLSAARTRDAMMRLARRARKVGTALLVSLHFMTRTPSIAELDEWMDRAAELGAARFKVAAFAKTRADAQRLSRWALECDAPKLPITAIAMGEAGSPTRWKLPLLLGGPAYAPLGEAVAPGQISYDEMVKKLTGRT